MKADCTFKAEIRESVVCECIVIRGRVSCSTPPRCVGARVHGLQEAVAWMGYRAAEQFPLFYCVGGVEMFLIFVSFGLASVS